MGEKIEAIMLGLLIALAAVGAWGFCMAVSGQFDHHREIGDG